MASFPSWHDVWLWKDCQLQECLCHLSMRCLQRKQANMEITDCLLNCAEFVLDSVRVRVLFRLEACLQNWYYISHNKVALCAAAVSWGRKCNAITTRKPTLPGRAQVQENPCFCPSGIFYFLLCSSSSPKCEHHFSSRGSLGHILCAKAGRCSFSFFPLSQIVLPPPLFI